jgi:hypothetical protein
MRRSAESFRSRSIAGTFSEITAVVSVVGMLLALFVL